MASIVPHMESEHRSDYVFVDIEEHKKEGARETIARLGLPSVPYEEEMFANLPVGSAVVVMCDWSPWERAAVIRARQSGCATIGIVEGSQDWLDTHIEHLAARASFKPRYPYATVAERLLLGSFDARFVNGIVCGCARFDPLVEQRPPLPDGPVACVHSNFTYNLYEDIRDRWVSSAVEAIESAGWDYFLIHHPRDRGDLSRYKLYPNDDLHEAISNCSVFITRFSSVNFDALLLGRRIVYYNPHGERQPTFLEPMGAYPIIETARRLRNHLKRLQEDPGLGDVGSVKDDPSVRRFLQHHIGPLDGLAAQRSGQAISRLARHYAASSERTWKG